MKIPSRGFGLNRKFVLTFFNFGEKNFKQLKNKNPQRFNELLTKWVEANSMKLNKPF